MEHYVRDESVRNTVAGFLSTIDFKPSEKHPEEMLIMADQVIIVVLSSLLAANRRV